METQKLTTLEKVGFGAGDMALNVVISSMLLFITFFYTDIYGLNPVDMGILFFVVKIVGAFSDLAMGQITDRVTTRFGRYRPWLAWLSIPFGITVYLVFSTPEWSYTAKLVWAYCAYILMTLITSGVGIPYISLPSAITADPKERLSANGYRLFFAKIAGFLVVVGVPLLAERWTVNGNVAGGYQSAMAVMAALGVTMFLFCYFTTRERVHHVIVRQSLLSQTKLLFQNDQWLLLAGACVVGTVGYVVRNAVALHYGQYYMGFDPTTLKAFMATGVSAAICAMVVSTWITKIYCKVKLFAFSQIAVAIISVLLYVGVQPGDTAMAFLLYFLLSLVVDLHAPVFWSAIAETIDYGHIKSGKRVSGFAYGGISVGQKIGMGVGGLMVGMLLAHFGYHPNQPQTAYAMTGIAMMLTVIPGFFHLLMGLLMLKYRISDSYYVELKADMNRRGYAAG